MPSKPTSRGLIIAFDGPDGVGKTTQLQLTADYLTKLGKEVHTTRASGGTPIGEELRKVSLSPTERPAEVDVYISLAMHTALGMDLETRKQRGQICLVDRSPLAVIAYNVVASKLAEPQLGYDAFERLIELWAIDTLIIFNADPTTVRQRREARATTDAAQKTDYFESKGKQYHQLIREGYKQAIQIVKDHPQWGINLVEIDAAPSLEQVQAAVRQQLPL